MDVGLGLEAEVNKRQRHQILILFAILSLVSCAVSQGVLRPAAAIFDVNGCSDSPDLDIRVCCDLHDVGYRIGGTPEGRLRVDGEFRICIEAHGRPVLAAVYYRAVRLFGASHFTDRAGD